ncbi:hypothetical protein COI87_20230 [Bacillus thuringiensis]|nr:hypothetical protein DN403_20580 [Bacillus sp. AY2-1]PFJ09957.1 hypothetical protein COI87_20230 [Bacillus thuringiensis]
METNLATFKKEYMINYYFEAIPMFIFMNLIFNKDIIEYFQHKDWIHIISYIYMYLVLSKI